jgi:hypothetical protein
VLKLESSWQKDYATGTAHKGLVKWDRVALRSEGLFWTFSSGSKRDEARGCTGGRAWFGACDGMLVAPNICVPICSGVNVGKRLHNMNGLCALVMSEDMLLTRMGRRAGASDGRLGGACERGTRACVWDLETDKEDMIDKREGKRTKRSGAGAGSAEVLRSLVAVIVLIFAVRRHLVAH